MLKDLLQSESFWTGIKGALGMGATSTGVYVSVLGQVESWLRIISLCVGIAVGTATFISLLITIKKRRRDEK